MHILLSINTSWNVVNFRSGLVRGLLADGHTVTVAAPRDAFSDAIVAMGCRFIPLPIDAHGRSPVGDLRLFARYLSILRKKRPDAFLGYTPKPNVYGSLAAQLLGIPVVNNIAGLGLIFNERGLTHRVLRGLYRLALRRSTRVFFQNAEDRDLFVARGLAPADRTVLLPGSGVDLTRFAAEPLPARPPLVFLLVARLLREKGVAELVEAGRRVRARHPDAEVRILGFVEDGKSSFVSRAELDAWQRAGDAVYLGTATDVRPHIAAAHCVVLPTYYREGTPRTLLEAAATGRPIITTDMPGCRTVVADGESGYLVAPRDVASLAEAMAAFADLGDERRAAMGRAARARAETLFDERIIVTRYREVLAAIERKR